MRKHTALLWGLVYSNVDTKGFNYTGRFYMGKKLKNK